jgi:hypothetical protein
MGFPSAALQIPLFSTLLSLIAGPTKNQNQVKPAVRKKKKRVEKRRNLDLNPHAGSK